MCCQMRYIQPFPGQYVSMDPTAVIDVYGLIGTPALWKEHAALVWRVGPSYLFEEALSADAVKVIYTQGTGYLGNFLGLHKTGESQDFYSMSFVSLMGINLMFVYELHFVIGLFLAIFALSQHFCNLLSVQKCSFGLTLCIIVKQF